jgi:hypothetical protein
MIRGEIVTEPMDNGMTRFFSKEFPPLPEIRLREFALRVGQELNR